ncbi:hypothetical protein SFUMM280S_01106 [Streptomyces fumanus]
MRAEQLQYLRTSEHAGLTGALAGLEWAAQETERRLIAVNRARQEGLAAAGRHPAAAVDPAGPPRAFAHLASADGRPDPQSLLQVPRGTAARPR